MNLAILIAVSTYTKPTPDLLACKNDANVMKQLLQATNKFEHILDLSDDTKSVTVKQALSQFIKQYQGQAIDEVFFYYSGHGDIYKESFHYLFSDYSENQKAQTSLSNDELDELLRSLNPKFTIKVVDACFSATTYVKEPDALSKQLNKSKGRFSHCYFMFSSQSNQPSHQDDDMSFFTRAFLLACIHFSGQEIRYQDIADYVADYFSTDPNQTPVFVSQSTLTEIFCNTSDAIKQLPCRKPNQVPGDVRVVSFLSPTALPTPIERPSLVAAVKAQSVDFCTKEETKQFFIGLHKCLEGGNFTGEISELYHFESAFAQSYHNIVDDISTVGSWLKENRKDYFAKLTYRHEPYEEQRLTIGGGMYSDVRREPVTKYRDVLSGIEITADVMYNAVKFLAKPLFENLPYALGAVIFVFSKKEIVFFHCFQVVRELDWGSFQPIQNPKWLTITQNLKSDLSGSKSASNLLGKFEEFVEQACRKRVGLTEGDVKKEGTGK